MCAAFSFLVCLPGMLSVYGSVCIEVREYIVRRHGKLGLRPGFPVLINSLLLYSFGVRGSILSDTAFMAFGMSVVGRGNARS